MQLDLELVIGYQMGGHALDGLVSMHCELPKTLSQLDEDLVLVEQGVVETLAIELEDLVDHGGQGDRLVDLRLLIAWGSVDLGTHV